LNYQILSLLVVVVVIVVPAVEEEKIVEHDNILHPYSQSRYFPS